MAQEKPDQSLNLISTLWSVVLCAHHGPGQAAQAARRELLDRYGGAIRRFLHKRALDPDAIDETFQEFALRLLHGDLRGADPERGRFRDFVKGTLFHLVAKYRRQNRRWPGPLPNDGNHIAARAEEAELDRQFLESWCDELLARAWAALAEIETKTGRLYYTMLRFRAITPELRSPQMAQELSAQLSKPLTAVGLRQTLHRARDKFAALLLEEVAHSLESPSVEHLERELINLGLFAYCQPALASRPEKGPVQT